MKTVVFITFCHIFFFFLLFTKRDPHPHKIKPTPISVITTTIKESSTPSTSFQTVIEPAKPKEDPPPPQKKESIIKTSESKPKTVNKKEASVPKKKVEPKKATAALATKKTANPNQKKALELLKKSLSKVDNKKEGGQTNITSSITLQSEKLQYKSTFEEELILYLQNQLMVPHPGNVSLLLTLTHTGKVKEVKITKCALSENREYLEITLPKLTYPPFTSHFPQEKSRSFSLTFHIE